jgi:hypothetical protein
MFFKLMIKFYFIHGEDNFFKNNIIKLSIINENILKLFFLLSD